MGDKEYFTDLIDRTTKLMQRSGHITRYFDMSDEDNKEGIELQMRLQEALQLKTEAQWIEAGVSLAEIEKCKHFLNWQERLNVAGVYNENKDPVCAQCFSEEDWDNIDHYEYEEIISHSDGDKFICSVCGKKKGGSYPNT